MKKVFGILMEIVAMWIMYLSMPLIYMSIIGRYNRNKVIERK